MFTSGENLAIPFAQTIRPRSYTAWPYPAGSVGEAGSYTVRRFGLMAGGDPIPEWYFSAGDQTVDGAIVGEGGEHTDPPLYNEDQAVKIEGPSWWAVADARVFAYRESRPLGIGYSWAQTGTPLFDAGSKSWLLCKIAESTGAVEAGWYDCAGTQIASCGVWTAPTNNQYEHRAQWVAATGNTCTLFVAQTEVDDDVSTLEPKLTSRLFRSTYMGGAALQSIWSAADGQLVTIGSSVPQANSKAVAITSLAWNFAEKVIIDDPSAPLYSNTGTIYCSILDRETLQYHFGAFAVGGSSLTTEQVGDGVDLTNKVLRNVVWVDQLQEAVGIVTDPTMKQCPIQLIAARVVGGGLALRHLANLSPEDYDTDVTMQSVPSAYTDANVWMTGGTAKGAFTFGKTVQPRVAVPSNFDGSTKQLLGHLSSVLVQATYITPDNVMRVVDRTASFGTQIIDDRLTVTPNPIEPIVVNDKYVDSVAVDFEGATSGTERYGQNRWGKSELTVSNPVIRTRTLARVHSEVLGWWLSSKRRQIPFKGTYLPHIELLDTVQFRLDRDYYRVSPDWLWAVVEIELDLKNLETRIVCVERI